MQLKVTKPSGAAFSQFVQSPDQVSAVKASPIPLSAIATKTRVLLPQGVRHINESPTITSDMMALQLQASATLLGHLVR